MIRDGYDKIISEAVSHVLGSPITLIGQGRAKDGRYHFARPQKSECHVCTVSFLKDYVASEYNMPCEAEEQPYCRVRRLAQAITTLGSPRAVEDGIEARLRNLGVPSEASLGRGNAYNMSIIVKIGEAGRLRLGEMKAEAKRERDAHRLASNMAQALDVLSPPLPR